MFTDNEPSALVFAFIVFLLLFQHLGYTDASSGLLWIPGALLLIPLGLLAWIGTASFSYGGLFVLLVVLGLFGLYFSVAREWLGTNALLIGVLAAVILLLGG